MASRFGLCLSILATTLVPAGCDGPVPPGWESTSGMRVAARFAGTTLPEDLAGGTPGRGDALAASPAWAAPGFVPDMSRQDADVYRSIFSRYPVFLTRRGGVVLLGSRHRGAQEDGDVSPAAVQFDWGGSHDVAPEGRDEQPGRVAWFVGDDPSRWATGLKRYRTIQYAGIAPGADLCITLVDDTLTLAWQVHPPATIDDVTLELTIPGIDPHPLDQDRDGGTDIIAGDVMIRVSPFRLHGSAPTTAQRRPRIVFEGGRIKLSPGTWEPSLHTFTVSTSLSFSMLAGGGADDTATAVAIDRDGAIVVAGQTWSPDFPVVGGYDSSFNGMNTDAYVMKFDPTGTALQFATFIGGSTGGSSGYVGWDMIRDIALDADGAVVAVGYTYATDFPTTSNAVQGRFAGGYTDMVVCKLSPDGGTLQYATYYGGSDNETAEAVAVDRLGRMVVAAYTYSTDFPTTGGAFQTANRGYADAAVIRFDPDGASVDYATLIGGSAGSSGAWGDYAKAVAVDRDDRVWVAGHTLSVDFPVSPNAAQWSLAGSYDGFLAVLAPDGASLDYATYLGGTGMDTVADMALDDVGQACIVGATTSADFPVTDQALQNTLRGAYDAIVVRLNPAIAGPDGLVFSSYLGGAGSDQARSVAVDTSGDIHVTGSTGSTDFPVTSDAVQVDFGGGDTDAFVISLGQEGGLNYSTFFGGSGYDNGVALDVADSGATVIAGTTQSSDFAASQTGFSVAEPSSVNTDVFVARFVDEWTMSGFVSTRLRAPDRAKCPVRAVH